MTNTSTKVYRPYDWDLMLSAQDVADPYGVQLWAVAQGPGGRCLRIPGFYAGGGRWCIRFAPTAPGVWQLESASTLPALAGQQKEVEATVPANPQVHGPLQVDPHRPNHFRYADGTPCFLMGYELNWLWALGQTAESPARMHRLLDVLGEAGFNHLLVNAYAHDTSWRKGRTGENDFGPPEHFVWQGDVEDPDYLNFNPAYFDHFDRMMWALWERGMDCHLYFKVYNKHVPWPAPRSEGDRRFFDYYVARYQAFPNLVWDFSKEAKYEPDKGYIAERVQRIRRLDAYDHLVTVHDDTCFIYQDRWRRMVDFVTDQNHSGFYETVVDQRQRGLGPIINAEYGYEHGPGGPDDHTYGVVQSPKEVLMRTYEVIMGGGYPAYYYTNHAWDVIEWDEVPPGLPAYRHLRDFFTSFDWQALEPRVEMGRHAGHFLRCLTDGTDELVVFSRDGRGALVPPADWDGTSWSGYWLNIWTGRKADVRIERLEANRFHRLRAPFDREPAVAYLRRLET